MKETPAISVVIPAYHSEKTLPKLVPRLAHVLKDAAASFEVILVDDGSWDETWNVILALAREYPFIRGFQLMRNYGQHNALLCGIRVARGDIVVTMDDDLQNPPEEVPRLLAKLAEGYDVVYGTPQKESHGMLRDAASQITKLVLQKTMGARPPAKLARSGPSARVCATHLPTTAGPLCRSMSFSPGAANASPPSR